MDWLVGTVNLTIVCLRPTYDCKGVVMIGKFRQGGFMLLPMYWLELSLSDTNFKNREHCLFCPRLYM